MEGIAQAVETVLVPNRGAFLNDMKNPCDGRGPHSVDRCEPSSHFTTLFSQCVWVRVCNCVVSLSQRVDTCTWRRISVLSTWKCDWWPIHQALDGHSATYDVFILSSYEFRDWCLYCISACCKMPYVRSYEMWFSALFFQDLSPPVWPTYELCRKPPWKTWNKTLHKL